MGHRATCWSCFRCKTGSVGAIRAAKLRLTFCNPSEGLRHIYIGACGIDIPLSEGGRPRSTMYAIMTGWRAVAISAARGVLPPAGSARISPSAEGNSWGLNFRIDTSPIDAVSTDACSSRRSDFVARMGPAMAAAAVRRADAVTRRARANAPPRCDSTPTRHRWGNVARTSISAIHHRGNR